jgi:hypothetical protein
MGSCFQLAAEVEPRNSSRLRFWAETLTFFRLFWLHWFVSPEYAALME